ncbi:MAG: hypothetical protein LC793_18885 [Thermomicrobia bacterium]|nr:hypothetical protein [Thermomicrobia bacterium]MCA1725686.1 hypothetical protein [Thermomicrobia bacterium]
MGQKMHGRRLQHGIAATILRAVIVLLLTSGEIVMANAVDRSATIARGVIAAAPSPTATSVSASVKTSTGGGARWGFLLAIFAAFAIFVVGGLFVILRSRSEYLDEQRRKATMANDET